MYRRFNYNNKDFHYRSWLFIFFLSSGWTVLATFLIILSLFSKNEIVDLEFILGAVFTYLFSTGVYYMFNIYRPIEDFGQGIKIKVFFGLFFPITIYWEDIHSFSYFNQTDSHGIQIYYLTLKKEKRIFIWRIRGLRISSSMIKFDDFENLINQKIRL